MNNLITMYLMGVMLAMGMSGGIASQNDSTLSERHILIMSALSWISVGVVIVDLTTENPAGRENPRGERTGGTGATVI